MHCAFVDMRRAIGVGWPACLAYGRIQRIAKSLQRNSIRHGYHLLFTACTYTRRDLVMDTLANDGCQMKLFSSQGQG